jgi:TonB family protein
MRALWFVALFAGLGASIFAEQQTSPSAPPPVPDAQPAKVMVYTMGPGVTAPELIPVIQAPIPNEKCKKKVNAEILLSTYIDAAGVPNNITLLQPNGSELDEMAFKIVAEDRFKPGTYNGAPVAVAMTAEVTLRTCIEEKEDSSGRKTNQMRLRSLPEQQFKPLDNPPMEAVLSPGAINTFKMAGGVSPPRILIDATPEFTDEARRAKYQGVCIVSLIVDAHGMPQNVRVVRPLGMGLDEKAVEAAKKFRFKPAMKNGVPVPVTINIEVNFRLYEKR